jgi:excisionase family DNA binding protein
MPISTDEAAKRQGVTKRRIQRLIQQDRIPGAVRLNRDWMVPDDFIILPADNPKDHPAQKIKTKTVKD